MMTCRKCGEPAEASRSEYTNERAFFIYSHKDGREHRAECWIVDAQKWATEDLLASRSQ